MGYGQNLKKAARKNGISIMKLGKSVGISPTTLYSAISRDKGLRLDHALRVAEYLGINPEMICGQCRLFSMGPDIKDQTDQLLSRIKNNRKRAIIQKQVETMIGFDEGRLAAAEVLLELLQSISTREAMWLLSILNVIFQHPDDTSLEEAARVEKLETETAAGVLNLPA